MKIPLTDEMILHNIKATWVPTIILAAVLLCIPLFFIFATDSNNTFMIFFAFFLLFLLVKMAFDTIKLGIKDFCVLKRECINVVRTLNDLDYHRTFFQTRYVFDNNITVPFSTFQIIGLPRNPSKEEKQEIGKTFYLIVYRFKANNRTAIKIYDCNKYEYIGSNFSD